MTVQALTERLRDDVDLERVEADVLSVPGPDVPSVDVRHVAPRSDQMTGHQTFAVLGVGLAVVGAVGTAVIQYASSAPVVGAVRVR